MKKLFPIAIFILIIAAVSVILKWYLFSVILISFAVFILIVWRNSILLRLKDIEGAVKEVFSTGRLRKFTLNEGEETLFLKEQLNNLFDFIMPFLKSKNEAEEWVKELIDIIESPVIVADQSGKILLFNRAAEIFMRRKCKNCFYYEALNSMDLIDVVGKCINNTLSQKEVKILGKFYRVNSFEKKKPNGETLIACSFFDITLYREKDIFEREFISAVSHELKTPLAAIVGASEALEEENDEANRKKFVRMIKSNAERMNNLVKNLLILSEIRIKGKRKFKRVNLKECVLAVTEASKDTAKNRNVSLKKYLKDVWVLGNEFLLTEMVRNIVSNAVKYSEGGEVQISLIKDSFAEIIVKDSGPGISEEALPHIFEPFYRADSSRSRSSGGTGLGLTIAKRIAVMHGGNITVKSILGKGSEFIIQLPLLT